MSWSIPLIASRTAGAVLALWILVGMGSLEPARAQEAATPAPAAEAPATPPAPTPAEEDFGKPMGPTDPLNRGTPRGSMYGYIVAARNGDYERAAEFLDLRRLPPSGAERGPELARHFKTVLDQTLWVDFTTLSDSNDGIGEDGLPAWQDRLGQIRTSDGYVDLLLQRVPRQGDGVRIWKISSGTVAQIDALYAEFGPGVLEQWLPEVFFEHQFFEIWLWQWGAILLILLAAWLIPLILAGGTIRVLHHLFARDAERLDPRIVRVIRGPVRVGLGALVFGFGVVPLGLPLSALESLRLPVRILLVVSVAWLVMRVIDIGVLVLSQRLQERGQESIVPVLVPSERIVKALVFGFGLLAILAVVGVNVTAAVAGLGIGGIAFALAAQKTIENLFGGVALFGDRPLKVGDFCRFGTQVGTVEEIGLRSTRIRTLDRTVVSIPNAQFSELQLENFAVRDRMRLFAMIGVRYETSPEQLRYLLARLRELLLAHPRITDDPARVRFVGFGAYSLDLEIFAYANTSDWGEFLEIREDIYLRIMDVVAEAGTGFAFPSSTTYVGRDEGLDAERTKVAEERVRAWRKSGALPFPHFPEELVQEKKDTLDWPPAGSPKAANA